MTIKTGLQNLLDRFKAQFPATPEDMEQMAERKSLAPPTATIHARIEPKVDDHQPGNGALDALTEQIRQHGEQTMQLVREVDDHVVTRVDESGQLVRQLDSRLEAQSADLARFGAKLESLQDLGTLPQVADAADEIRTQCARLLEIVERPADSGREQITAAIEDSAARLQEAVGRLDERVQAQLAEARSGSESVKSALDGAVERLTEGATRGHESMESVRRQVESATIALKQSGQRSEALAQVVRGVGEATNRLQQSIGELNRTTQQRDEHLAELIRRNKRSMQLFIYSIMLAMLLALAMATVSFFVG